MLDVKRVTIVTETFSPEVNGVANTLNFLVEGLRARGVSVQIIRPRQSVKDEPKQSPIFQTVLVPGLPIPGYKQLKFGLPRKRHIRKALTYFQPDAMYIATEGPLGLTALRAAKTQKIPVLSGFHTNFHQYFSHYHLGLFKGLVFRYLRSFHNATQRTLAPTPRLQVELEGASFKNVHVMSRGIDVNLFSPYKRSDSLRESWGVGTYDPVVIYVGRIADEKNIRLALNSFSSFKKHQPTAKLVIVGDGPLRASLEESYPHVHFTGELRGEALAQAYASGDVFVFPSMTDTFGNVVLEAMASGLYVLGFNYAAPAMLIEDRICGALARYGDALDFNNQLADIAMHWQEHTSIREQARAQSLRYSWKRINYEFLRHLAQIKEEAPYVSKQKSLLV